MLYNGVLGVYYAFFPKRGVDYDTVQSSLTSKVHSFFDGKDNITSYSREGKRECCSVSIVVGEQEGIFYLVVSVAFIFQHIWRK